MLKTAEFCYSLAMYEKLLQEVEIRIKDLCLTFVNLQAAGAKEEDREAAISTFNECVSMLELVGKQCPGFKQLLKVSIEQIETN